METEDRMWVWIIGLVAAVIITLIASAFLYNGAVDTAAIAKGLCSGTVPGSNAIVWTTCPLAK